MTHPARRHWVGSVPYTCANISAKSRSTIHHYGPRSQDSHWEWGGPPRCWFARGMCHLSSISRACQAQKYSPSLSHTSPALASSGSAVCPGVTLMPCERFAHWKLPPSNISNSGLGAITLSIFAIFAETTLLKGQAPKLQTFSLIQIFIPWELIPHSLLTQLKITLSGVLSISPSDMNQLIDLLIDSPDLEELILKFCLPPLPSQVSPKQQIYLPHLSSGKDENTFLYFFSLFFTFL